MNSLYFYDGRVSEMTPTEVLAAYKNIELKCRTGSLAYVDVPLFQEQIDQMKSLWPTPAKDFIKQRVKQISAGNSVTPSVIKQALIETIKGFWVPSRVTGIGPTIEQEAASLFAELSLCSMFRTIVRTNAKCGSKTVRIKATTSPRKLVINVGEEQAFDVYVLAASLPCDTAYLVGWIGKEELAAAPSGNSETDPKNCHWRSMAHYIPAEQLRPMSELALMSGFKEFQSGMFFETPPQRGWLPMEATRQQKDVWRLKHTPDNFDETFDFKPSAKEAAK